MSKIWVLGVIFIEFECCTLKKKKKPTKIVNQEIQERTNFPSTEYFQTESVAFEEIL